MWTKLSLGDYVVAIVRRIKLLMLSVCQQSVSVQRLTSHSTHNSLDHFSKEYFQTINCTDIDNQTITTRKYTKHELINPNTNKMAVVKPHTDTKARPKCKPVDLVRTAHISVHMTVHNCVTQYSTE